MDNTDYTIQVSGNAPKLYPTDTLFGLLWYSENEAIEIPKALPYYGEWGDVISEVLPLREDFPMPTKLNLLWLAITEQKFYEVEATLPVDLMKQKWNFYDIDEDTSFSHIVVGMAPYGKVTIWFHGTNKSVIIDCLQGILTEIEMEDFLPFYSGQTLHQYCNQLMEQIPSTKQNLETNGLPPRDLFDNYMKQFTYRYLPLFEHWDEDEEIWMKYTEDEQETKPELDYIEEALYDGTHDKLHDGGLLTYHEAGKPKKLAVKWHIKKSEYTAYFWFEDEDIRAVFDRFYGLHPDTKTDFILHIDPMKNQYQLALFRYGLKEPQVIPEETYQLIVFKNKFEHFRSKNYNQPRGAWIW